MALLLILALAPSLAFAQAWPSVNSSLANCDDGKVAKVVSGAWACGDDATGDGGEGLPSGAIVMVDAGPCPDGYDEVALGGKFVLLTTHAAGDVGTTGGADTITDVIDHTHDVTVTDPGHAHVENKNSATSGGLSGWSVDTSTNTSVESGYSTQSATTGITASTANPSGGVASLDNRPAFTRLIGCKRQ